MSLHLKRLVSGAQARFVQDGIDLDLVYITDRLLIMAFPASGVPTVWRNNRHEVRRFLDERHGKGWRVWNFRPKDEGEYDEEDFYGRVSRYPFPDHHPPPLSLIPMAVADMTAWLAEDPKNVIVIHCKAGKGRSGTMACSYFISLPKLPTPPQDSRNISIAKHKGKNGQDIHTQSSEPLAVPSEDSQTPHSSQASAGDEYKASTWRSKVEAALALHSSQRMKPKSVSAGPLAVSVNTVSSANYADGQSANGLTGRADLKRPRSLALGLVPGGTVSGVPGGASVAGALHSSNESSRRGAGGPPNVTTAPERQGEDTSLDTRPQTPSAASDLVHDEGDEEESHGGLSLAGRVGVSIASQRRWMGYWARVLAQRDARASLNPLAPAQPARSIRILRISILQDLETSVEAPGAASAARRFGKLDSFKLFVGRYDTALVEQLEDFERDARSRARANGHGSPGAPPHSLAQHGNEEGVGQWGFDVIAEAEKARRFNWPDARTRQGRTFEFFDWFAKLKESERVVEASEEGHTGAAWHHFGLDPASSDASSKANLASLSKSTSTKAPSSSSSSSSQSQGLLVPADRELCLRVQSRNKVLNALLPEIASSAGWVWLIPAFEEPRAADGIRNGDRTTVRFPREEVDFAKKITGLRAVQVEWEWVSTGSV